MLFLIFLPFCLHAKPSSVSVGKHGMVVSAQHLATQVGINILKRGGNAVDAAVAMGYALAVVEPCCGNIGGGGFMMIHLSDGTETVVNFREKAPSTTSCLQKNKKEPSFAAVGIPGTVKGLNAALTRFGSMPLKSLIQPAIQLADVGFTLQHQEVLFLGLETDAFLKKPNVAGIFLKNNRPYQVGERLVQKQLGETLRLIAEQGEYAFYQGSIANALVQASKENGGSITLQDLANYRATFEKPVRCHYRGYNVITTPLPSTGGGVLCELLNVAQKFPLKEYGYGSLKSLTTNLDTMKSVYQQTGKLGSKKHEPFNTTSYLVVDKKGNWVAVTYSLNGAFGAKVIAGQTGFFLNNQLKDFTYAQKPNRQPTSSITQVLMLKQQTPFLMLATAGGDTIPTQLLTTIENFIDYRMSLQAAVNAPHYHFRWQAGTVHLEPEWANQGKKTLLESYGYRIGKGSGAGLTDRGLPYWGAMTAIYRDAQGRFEGVIDKRRPSGMARGL